MQIMLEGGAKVEEDRAAGGEATATAGNNTNTTTTTTTTDVAAAPPNGNGGGLFVEHGRAEGAAERGVATAAGGSGGAAAWASEPLTGVTTTAETKQRQFGSTASAKGDSPRSKAVAAGAALATARDEQHTAPLLTPQGGSATMAVLAKDEAAAAGSTGAASVAGTGEGPFTPRRTAKQVGFWF